MINLDLIHTTSGIIVLLAFTLKVGIHIYLDNSLGKAKSWQSILFFPLPFMTTYREKVGTENLGLKNLGNLMFYTCIIALCVNLIVGIWEYQTK